MTPRAKVHTTGHRSSITQTPYVLPHPARLPTSDNGSRDQGIAMQSRDWYSGRSDGLATIAAGHEDGMYGPSSTVAFLKHVMPAHGSGASTPLHHDTREDHNSPSVRPRSSAPAATVPDRMVRIVTTALTDRKAALTPSRYEQQTAAFLFYL